MNRVKFILPVVALASVFARADYNTQYDVKLSGAS